MKCVCVCAIFVRILTCVLPVKSAITLLHQYIYENIHRNMIARLERASRLDGI